MRPKRRGTITLVSIRVTGKRKRDFSIDLCNVGTPYFYRGCCEHDYRRSFLASKMREGIERVIFDEDAGKTGPRQRREADLANTSIYNDHQIHEHRGTTQLETSPRMKDGSWSRSVSALIAAFSLAWQWVWEPDTR